MIGGFDLSERYQKTFISIREFVESWDKELYELNHLDFFIYLFINHLGNQLERQFFHPGVRHSDFHLEFDHIGTLSFNIGDAFEFFLKENCLNSCPLGCPLNLDGYVHPEDEELHEQMLRKIRFLQSYPSEPVQKEQCFRLDLMNHVVIDTIIQFYSEEFHTELAEDDPFLIELAEFIEDVTVEFIRTEGQTWLHKPFESALKYFEDLLQSEEEESQPSEWSNPDIQSWDESSSASEWQVTQPNIHDVFTRFTSDLFYNPGGNTALAHDISFFHRYLHEFAGLEGIDDIEPTHLAEFFSVWLVREFVMADEREISHIFRATARFITFLYHHYQINLKRDFLEYYEKIKTDLPRVVQANNLYISDFDIFSALYVAENHDYEYIDGYFEILDTIDRKNRLINVEEITLGHRLSHLKFDSAAYSKIQRGDILHATLIRKQSNWEVMDVQYIYPGLARQFLLNKF